MPSAMTGRVISLSQLFECSGLWQFVGQSWERSRGRLFSLCLVIGLGQVLLPCPAPSEVTAGLLWQACRISWRFVAWCRGCHCPCGDLQFLEYWWRVWKWTAFWHWELSCWTEVWENCGPGWAGGLRSSRWGLLGCYYPCRSHTSPGCGPARLQKICEL